MSTPVNVPLAGGVERRKPATFECPSGGKIEYACEGRWAEGDPWMFHFHGMYPILGSCILGPAWETYSHYGKSPDWTKDDWAKVPLKMVSISRPGYGLSTMKKEAHEWSYQDFVADIAALADHLGGETFAVMGGSSGANNSLACAALLPTRVTAVLAIAADRSMHPELLEASKQTPLPYKDGIPWVRPGTACGPGGFCFCCGCGCCCRCCWPRGFQADVHVEVKKPPFSYSDIRCPTWIVHGEKDTEVDVNCANYFAQEIPQAKKVMLPGAHCEVGSSDLHKLLDDLAAAAKLTPGTVHQPAQQAMAAGEIELAAS